MIAAPFEYEAPTTVEEAIRLLSELGDRVPTHERARAEMLVSDARQALKEEAPVERLRSLVAELQGVYQGLVATGQSYGGGTPGAGGGQGSSGPAPGGGQGPGGGDDDVIDAEFTPS